MSEEHDDLVERLEDVSPIPDAMNQMPVKWVHQERLVDEQASVDVSTLPGYIPGIPLSALREVVEGLEKLAFRRPFLREDRIAYSKEIKEPRCISIHQWLAQRLLAGLGEAGK